MRGENEIIPVELGLETWDQSVPRHGCKLLHGRWLREEAGTKGIVIELAGRADDEGTGGLPSLALPVSRRQG